MLARGTTARRAESHLLRPSRASSVLAGIAMLASISLAACGNDEAREAPPRVFESQAWKNGDWKVRSQMAHDLVDRRLLIGKSRMQVESLLGKPDQEGGASFAYFIDPGPSGSLGPPYYIHVEFDQAGKTAKDAWITD